MIVLKIIFLKLIVNKKFFNKYIKFLKEGFDSNVNFELGMKDPRIIGDDEFVKKQILNTDNKILSIELSQIIKSTCQVLNVRKISLQKKTKSKEIIFARHMIAYLNKHYGNSTMQSVATQFLLDLSTLSRALTSFETKIKDPIVGKIVKKIKDEMGIQ